MPAEGFRGASLTIGYAFRLIINATNRGNRKDIAGSNAYILGIIVIWVLSHCMVLFSLPFCCKIHFPSLTMRWDTRLRLPRYFEDPL